MHMKVVPFRLGGLKSKEYCIRGVKSQERLGSGRVGSGRVGSGRVGYSVKERDQTQTSLVLSLLRHYIAVYYCAFSY